MDDKIKKLRIREIDVRIANLKQNIGSMENKIKELSDRKNELITENIVFNKLQSLGLITKYSSFIKQ
jgi:hypothetical protein